MLHEGRWPVILLPGGILPAQPAYQALLAELGADVEARAKDLEMYAGPSVPPPDYSLETEVEGIHRLAENAGFETFLSSGTRLAAPRRWRLPPAIPDDFGAWY